jgi:hypothetical protein
MCYNEKIKNIGEIIMENILMVLVSDGLKAYEKEDYKTALELLAANQQKVKSCH